MSDAQLDTILEKLDTIIEHLMLGGATADATNTLTLGGEGAPERPHYGAKCVFHGAFGDCACPHEERNRLFVCEACGAQHWMTFTPLGASRICRQGATA